MLIIIMMMIIVCVYAMRCYRMSQSSTGRRPGRRPRVTTVRRAASGSVSGYSDSDADDDALPMSYDEKRQLSLNVNKLSSKYCYAACFLDWSAAA